MSFIPLELEIAGLILNVHLIFEVLAFFIGFRYYVYLRRNHQDSISTINRLSIILGAAIGAFLGSRIVGILENPMFDLSNVNLLQLYNSKTIMGGLFGGLLGVEITKWRVEEKQSSGDLFTLPIIVGIFIGRIGCFLSGTNEFTYGEVTSFFAGMNLGDGLKRHPLTLYELLFLLVLFIILKRSYNNKNLGNGLLFQIFMLSYFGFRFLVEFIKPNVFLFFGLSTIQWLCIICFIYYHRTLTRLIHAK